MGVSSMTSTSASPAAEAVRASGVVLLLALMGRDRVDSASAGVSRWPRGDLHG